MLNLTLPGGFKVDDPSNPAAPAGAGNQFKFSNGSIGEVVSALLPYVMSFAGLILFVLFIFGGFTLLTSAGSEEKVKKGQSLITNALIGFAILFTSYWLIQIVEIVFGLNFGFF